MSWLGLFTADHSLTISSCVPLIERAPICPHVLWKYSASAYFPRTAEGWQFFDVALMYTGRQDSISLYIDIQDSILGPEILFSVTAGSVETNKYRWNCLEKHFHSVCAFRDLTCTYCMYRSLRVYLYACFKTLSEAQIIVSLQIYLYLKAGIYSFTSSRINLLN